MVLIAAMAPAQSACPDNNGTADRIASAWLSRQLVHGLPVNLATPQANCIRDRLVERLATVAGPVVGYKAGLTSRSMQDRFGHAGPVRGTLLETMLRTEAAGPIPAKFGARPVAEADLLVEVGNESINGARDHVALLRGLSRVIPFIELPDLMLAAGEPLSGAIITAINVGARTGVRARDGVPVEATPEFADRLAALRVVVTAEHGRVLAEAQGREILDHPLNAVKWLVEDLNRAGIRLRPGDLLSLGSFAPPIVPRPGMQLTVRYHGLAGNPAVSVRFE